MPPPFLGMFLLAMGILYLEVFATRVFAFVSGPEFLYSTIAVAMLGMSGAASAVSLMPEPLAPERARRLAGWGCFLGALGTLAAFAYVAWLKDALSAAEARALARDGSTALALFVQRSGPFTAAKIGLALSFVYFLLGGALALLFRSVTPDEVGRLYAVDLVGACVGCLLAVGLLELGSYGPPLAVAVALPLGAWAALSESGRGVALAIALLAGAGLASGPMALALEPKPNLDRLARNWDGPRSGAKIVELWHTWTSYNRIAALRVERPDRTVSHLMVHGNGEGHARVPAPHEGSPLFAVAVAGLDARSALVLLAGCGWDMVEIDRLAGGRAAITGVELVPQIVSWPLARPELPVRAFFARPQMRMEIAEAREFLSREHARYDSVFISFSGSSLAYRTGAASHVADHVYTQEGLDSLLDHLTPKGRLTLLNGNKVRLILSLRELLARRGIADASRAFVVLETPDVRPTSGEWLGHYDARALVVQPGGLSDLQIAALRAVGKLLYAPGMTAKDSIYAQAVLDPDPQEFRSEIDRRFLTDLSPATDDRPYLLDLMPGRAYLSWLFWSGKSGDFVWGFKRAHALTLFAFTLLSLAVVLGPVALARARGTGSRRTRAHLLYFSLLGAGFMLVEVGLLQKLSLAVGHPGLSLAVGLGSLVLFTGLGSLISSRFVPSLRALGLATAAVLALHCAAAEWGLASAMALGRQSKVALAFAFPALPGLLMGQFFPRGLAILGRENPAQVPWAIAINGAAGTVASGIGVTLAPLTGVRALFLGGVLAYLLVALVPLEEGREVD